MNGDVVRETFQMVLVNERRWWMRVLSQVYMYSFIFAFIYVGEYPPPACTSMLLLCVSLRSHCGGGHTVGMACISIMEEAFLLSRPPADGHGSQVRADVQPQRPSSADGALGSTGRDNRKAASVAEAGLGSGALPQPNNATRAAAVVQAQPPHDDSVAANAVVYAEGRTRWSRYRLEPPALRAAVAALDSRGLIR